MSAITLRRASTAPTARGSAQPSGYPTVDLLPPSVRERRALQALRGRLAMSLVLVVLVIALGYVGSILVASAAADEATAAEDERVDLQSQLASYAEAAQARSSIESVESAVDTVMGSEVLWAEQTRAIEAALPADTALTSFSAATETVVDETATPFTLTGIVGSASFTVTTTTLPDVAALLDALEQVPGVVDATFSSSSIGSDDLYSTSGTVTFGQDALSGRYGTATTETTTETTTEEAGS
ncbi:MAG TPA: hypothetical protein VGC67_14520 [Cellulomonas sp.]